MANKRTADIAYDKQVSAVLDDAIALFKHRYPLFSHRVSPEPDRIASNIAAVWTVIRPFDDFPLYPIAKSTEADDNA